MSSPLRFGIDQDGAPVLAAEISAGELSARILNWGAVIQDLRLAGHGAPLVLGFERMDDYLSHVNFFGAVAGRYANRIRDGRFTLDGERFQIDAGAPELHGLHGGRHGYARRSWTLASATKDSVTLSLVDADGTMGFPGTLRVELSYSLRPPATLVMEVIATTDRPTLCNIAQHSYFNLDDGGASPASDHRLMLAAEAYTPVDGALIPTGEVVPVDGSVFDFRTPRTLRPAPGKTFDFDHNFCLAPGRNGSPRRAAWVQGASSGVEMGIWTTEPGIQFYAGHFLPEKLGGLAGIRYGKYSGFCLEAQVWPDSPNRPYFPQAVLRPGETYRQTTEFRFRAG